MTLPDHDPKRSYKKPVEPTPNLIKLELRRKNDGRGFLRLLTTGPITRRVDRAAERLNRSPR